MPEEPKKIVYLFGAGATHAEKELACALSGNKFNYQEHGLLGSDVSKRVIRKLVKDQANYDILKKYSLMGDEGYQVDEQSGKIEVGGTSEEIESDVELLITFIESKIDETSLSDARKLKKLYMQDIRENLIIPESGEKLEPRLHFGLLELEEILNEKVLGYLSVNYDSIFDYALEKMEIPFNYGIDLERNVNIDELDTGKDVKTYLKLHGSFDWFLNQKENIIQIKTDDEDDEPQWLAPGLMKEYSNYPYNLLFGRAKELLTECDVLRIIGCSLNLNDLNLISLLFRTQKSGNNYRIEVIRSDTGSYNLKKSKLGLMLSFSEHFFEDDDYKQYADEGNPSKNYFLEWLLYMIKDSSSELENTTYLKQIEDWKSKLI